MMNLLWLWCLSFTGQGDALLVQSLLYLSKRFSALWFSVLGRPLHPAPHLLHASPPHPLHQPAHLLLMSLQFSSHSSRHHSVYLGGTNSRAFLCFFLLKKKDKNFAFLCFAVWQITTLKPMTGEVSNMGYLVTIALVKRWDTLGSKSWCVESRRNGQA